MKQVSIVYCKPCGYLKRAEAAAGAVKEKFGVPVSLTPGTGGIFEVRIGANVVAKREKGHFPDTQEIVAAVAGALKAR